MRKQMTFPLVAILGGIMAFIFRTIQNDTGFDVLTGLPIRGHWTARALTICLLLFAIVLAILAYRLPRKADAGVSFPVDFEFPPAEVKRGDIELMKL